MKNIIVRCNIDSYSRAFQDAIAPDDPLPRVGESVAVNRSYESTLLNKRLPTDLEVKKVLHTNIAIYIEVHYGKTQLETLRSCDINPYQ